MLKGKSLKPGSQNVVKQEWIDPSDMLLPPLYIKLESMKQFVEALKRDGTCFQYLLENFKCLREAKIEKGVFTGPDIKSLMKNDNFV